MRLSDTRLLLPRSTKPAFDLFTHGAIESLPDFSYVEVRGEVWFPMAGPIRDDPWFDYPTVDVRWERFAYSHGVLGEMFKQPDYRQHIARQVRHDIADEVARHWTINLTAEPVDRWRA